MIKKENGKHPPIATKPVGKEQTFTKAEIVQRGNNKKAENPPKVTATKIQEKKKAKTRGAYKKDGTCVDHLFAFSFLEAVVVVNNIYG